MLEENITQTSCLYIYTEGYIGYTKDNKLNFMKILLYIQGVRGGMCQTSGECSLSYNIPI